MLAIQKEAEKSGHLNDAYLCHLLEKLLDLVPETAGALISTFTNPFFEKRIGPASRAILDRITAR